MKICLKFNRLLNEQESTECTKISVDLYLSYQFYVKTSSIIQNSKRSQYYSRKLASVQAQTMALYCQAHP